MKTTIRVEIEIDDEYVDKRNNNLKRNYRCFGDKYKNEKEALKNYPLEKGIADIIEDCLRHKQEGILFCKTYVEKGQIIHSYV